MRRFDLRTQQGLAWGLLILIMTVYAVEMSHQAILRYDTFKATAFDLGNMDQVLWNTIHGRLFQFTNQAIDWYGPPTRLAIHFEPIILPLSLLYVFHADPRILLVFQTLALMSGALPVFLLTRRHIPEWPVLAVLMAGAYLLAPALLGLNIFDFHPVSLATPLLLYAILALAFKRYVWFLVACVLAASCKEDIPLTIAMFGILLVWKYKLPRLGITLIVGGLLWSFLAFKVIIPHFYPGVQANNYWYRYEALGSSPGAAVANLLIHPWLLFTTFFTLDRLYYLAGLVRSVGFLSLLAPEWLLPALPSLAVNLLSTDTLLYSGVYHYNAAIIPFVVLAAIYGARRLILIWQGWRQGDQEQGLKEKVEANPEQNVSVSGQGTGALLGDKQSETVQSGVYMQSMKTDRNIAPALYPPALPLATPPSNTTHPLATPPSNTTHPLATPPSNTTRPLATPPPNATHSLAITLTHTMRRIAITLTHTMRPLVTILTNATRPLSTTLTHSTRHLAQLRMFLLAQFTRLAGSLKPRLLRLTLPGWRSEQWRRFSERMGPLAEKLPVSRLRWILFTWIALMIGLNFWIAAPQLSSFWANHEPGSHEEHIQRLLALIPPDASVSAGTNLNPHLSERQLLAVFPSVCLDSACNHTVEYVVVDLNSLTTENRAVATSELNGLSKLFRIVARAEGVVLLIRRSV